MSNIPSIALSVRQPWAWAIIHAGKNIENRSWQAVNHGLKRRGRIAVHAAKGMTRYEYESASDFMASIGVICPAAIDLIRGAIIGSVEVVDVISKSESPWFFGPRGLILREPQPCDPIPSIGALGYFAWREDRGVACDPARWMIPEALRTTRVHNHDSSQTSMFMDE